MLWMIILSKRFNHSQNRLKKMVDYPHKLTIWGDRTILRD